MVTAGVYMVARSNAIFVLARTAMKTVADVGALDAISPPRSACVRTTSSASWRTQLSRNSATCSWRWVWARCGGLFHVFTHAFFKALRSGGSSVIHAMSGEQAAQHGDLYHRTSITHRTMFIATLAMRAFFPLPVFSPRSDPLQTWTSEGSASLGCG